MLFKINQDDLKQKITQAKWIEDVFNNMLDLCKPIMEKQYPYEIETKEAHAAAGRGFGARVCMLITASLVTGEEEYRDKAKDMYLYAIKTADSAYFEALNGHLAVGDGAFTYAICYDLLEDYLSEEEKSIAREAMRELGTYLYEHNTTWRLPHRGVTSCNHNSVHHGALGLCALILEEEEWLDFSLKRIRGFFDTFVDGTGYVTEGVSYSFYGLTNALVFSEAYYNSTGIDLVSEYENIGLIPNQFMEHMMPTNKLLSLNDHNRILGNSAPAMFLISKFGYSDGLYLWRQFEEGNKTYGAGQERGYQQGIVFPFLLHWINPHLPAVSPSKLGRPLSKHFDSGRVMMRTAWDDEQAAFVSFTSGADAHRGHNHPDQNSFTAHALGEEFLIDPGTFGKDCKSHNLVMVNSIGQYDGCSKGEIREFKDAGRYVNVIGDATEAYIWDKKTRTLIGYGVRNLTFIRYPYPMLIIRDDIQTEHDQENLYEFMMHTTTDNEFYQKDKSVYIKGSNHGNLCRIDMVNPEDITINLYDKVERNVHHYGQNHDLSKWHKEASISTKAFNPFFTSVITFGCSEEDLPLVTYNKEDELLKIQVAYKDGYKEVIEVKRFETIVTR